MNIAYHFDSWFGMQAKGTTADDALKRYQEEQEKLQADLKRRAIEAGNRATWAAMERSDDRS